MNALVRFASNDFVRWGIIVVFMICFFRDQSIKKTQGAEILRLDAALQDLMQKCNMRPLR